MNGSEHRRAPMVAQAAAMGSGSSSSSEDGCEVWSSKAPTVRPAR